MRHTRTYAFTKSLERGILERETERNVLRKPVKKTSDIYNAKVS
jgi:hypothetical protein